MMISLLDMVNSSHLQDGYVEYTIIGKSGAKFYHYCCDGQSDSGWGCGYRTLQSLCSWVVSNNHCSNSIVPSLQEIQRVLVEVNDKPQSFVGSNEWIGCFEASIIIDHLYKVSCKLIHIASGNDVIKILPQLKAHFQTVGSPVMIGGNIDCGSKTLLGVAQSTTIGTYQWKVLVADPHYIGQDTIPDIMKSGALCWHDLGIFDDLSFYNFCLPLQCFK